MFAQAVWFFIEICHKIMCFLSRYPEVTNIDTLITEKGEILQGRLLWHWIKTFQTIQLSSLPRQTQPEENATLTKIVVQD